MSEVQSQRRGNVVPFVLAFAAVCVGTAAVLAGSHFDAAAATIVFEGAVPLIDVLAAALAGAAVVRRVTPGVDGPLLVAAGAGVGVGLLSTLLLALGLAGWLNGATAWGMVLLLGVVGGVDVVAWKRRVAEAASTEEPGVTRRNARLRWLWLLAAPALGVALVAACLPPGLLWGGEPNGYDVTSYHLQVPREWFDLGRIAPLPHNAFSYFPLAQETLSLAMMHQTGGPWRAMYAAQFLSAILCAAAALAVAGAATRDDESDVAPGVVAGLLFCGAPWVVMLGGIAYDEPLLLLATALAAAFFVRAADAESPWRPALLAGLFVGLGVATKYPAVPMLGVAGGAALLLVLLVPRSQNPAAKAASPARFGRRVVLPCVAFVAGSCVFASPWLVRNLAWVGNPFFPLGTSVFGTGGWSAEQVARWDRAHAPAADYTRVGRLFGEILFGRDYGLLLWPAALVAAAVGVARRDRRIILLTLWLGGMLLIWLGFTHLQGRFFVVAIVPAAVAAGLLGGRLPRRGRPYLLGVAALSAVVGLAVVGPRLAGLIPRLSDPNATAFGVVSLSFATPFERPEDNAGRDVYLVGDARAFNYEFGRVHYKVVFSVPPAGGAARAWLGDALENAPGDAAVVISPSELSRLSRTYGTPPLEPAVAARLAEHLSGDGPAVVRMADLRAWLEAWLEQGGASRPKI